MLRGRFGQSGKYDHSPYFHYEMDDLEPQESTKHARFYWEGTRNSRNANLEFRNSSPWPVTGVSGLINEVMNLDSMLVS